MWFESVKIHKDQMNRASQTHARLEACLESNCEPSCEPSNSDVFVCSFLLKLVCSCLLKEPRRVPRVLYTKMYWKRNTTVKNCLKADEHTVQQERPQTREELSLLMNCNYHILNKQEC
jgi:hypothetical protein